MPSSRATLEANATTIAEETVFGRNTPARVGGWMLSLLEAILLTSEAAAVTDAIAADVTTLQDDVTALEAAVVSAEGDIDDLEAAELLAVLLDGSRTMTGDLALGAFLARSTPTGWQLNFGRLAGATGTAATSGGTVQASLTLTEGYGYDLTIAVSGTQANTGYLFHALTRVSVFRASGGGALKVADALFDPDDCITFTLTDPSDGSEQDSSDLALAVTVSSNDVLVTVTNNDASNALALTAAGIAIGGYRYAL